MLPFAREPAMLIRPSWGRPLLLLSVWVAGLTAVSAQQGLFESRQLTPRGEYTKGIEGPAVGPDGTLYVVSLKEDGTGSRPSRTIGKVSPGATKSEPFAKLLEGSVASGLRFDREGRMYVADWKQNRVLVFERGDTTAQVYFASSQFNQPNDLAMAADGTLYASDPSFKDKTGQVWRISRGSDGKASGEVMTSPRKMGITNGIDLSPDGNTLYVGESNTRELWAYRLQGLKLTDPRLVTKFKTPASSELDGLRTDVDGRIYVTRPGSGTVALVTADGTILREVRLRGKTPSNLTFGGPDGKTVFVTQVDGGYIETFRVDRPGREPCLQLGGAAC
jgi:sugar lactone lactonase YvrE